jgi:putative methyltransferase (TIGR04325 family)
MKSILKDLTPPFLWRLAKQIATIGEKPEWEYIPEGWQAQKKDPNIKGWNMDSVKEAYQKMWPRFVQNIESTLPLAISPESNSSRRDTLIFHNMIITYGYALAVSTRNKSSISMLDWGGGIGHYYLLSKKLCPDLKINYHCKDVPVLAEYGQTLFPEAHFYSDETCLNQRYDFILVSGSLHFSEDWQSILTGLAQATSDYLFITRLPIVVQAASYVMIQRAHKYGYGTEYLGWCLNKDEFIRCATESGLKLIQEFYNGENPVILNAPESCQYMGFLFKKLV